MNKGNHSLVIALQHSLNKLSSFAFPKPRPGKERELAQVYHAYTCNVHTQRNYGDHDNKKPVKSLAFLKRNNPTSLNG